MESAEIELGASAAQEVRRRKGRSAVTNGGRLHVVKTGDTKWSRRFRDILVEITSDIRDRDRGLSEAQRQLARRCATIAIACEKMEGEAAAGNDINLEVYGALTDRLGRCFQRLGLKRQVRDVSAFSDEWRADVKQRQIEREAAHDD
jgi:hypothetical protein